MGRALGALATCAILLAAAPIGGQALVTLTNVTGLSSDVCAELLGYDDTDYTGSCILSRTDMPRGTILLASPSQTGENDHGECMGDYVFPFLASELMWSAPVRAIFYFLLLMWCFLGVAIISDHFMAAIEVITSKEKVLIVQNEDGEPEEHRVLVWNETVANLTLMALGSSAPEILLSVVETVGTLDKEPEDGLGPSTIVGSAAFNLLCITSACIVALPPGEKRVIANYGVFMITGFFSVFAYVWMLIVLGEDGVVSVSEAFITLLFFPLLVALSYAESKSWWGFFGRNHAAKVRPEGHIISLDAANHTGLRDRRKFSLDHTAGETMPAEEDIKHRVITMELKEKGRIAELLQNMPRGMSDDDLAKAVAGDILKERTSAMRYRIDARRKLVGGRTVIQKRLDFLKRHTTKKFAQNSPSELDRLGLGMSRSMHSSSRVILENEDTAMKAREPERSLPRVSFTAYAYCVNENSGSIDLPVVRTGSKEDLELTSVVYYETRSGTARGGEDFEHTDGKLTFLPGETQKVISIKIIDDNVYEPDETFQVVLSVKGANHNVDMSHSAFSTAEVTIIDDDLPGTFTFAEGAVVTRESEGIARIKVLREKGIAGRVKVHYKTRDATAKAGVDYLEASGTLIFEHGVREAVFEVSVMDNKTYERDATFAVEFEIVNFPDCGALYGETRVASVTITSDEGYKATVDRIASLMRLHLENVEVGTGSWKEQFINALTVQGEDGEDPTALDCLLHVLSFGWKVLFALVPPTSYWNGKLSFFVSLLFILVLTAVVGDVAKMFGCLVGVPTSLTAITFVALGTSLPDTFASKTAAENDDTADNSIGNITGSNSVNVFLGLGLPWVIGSVYKSMQPEVNGEPQVFIVMPGALSFSVLVFCVIAVLYFVLMYMRRRLGLGELGGPSGPKWASSVVLLCLWGVYVTLSGLQSKGLIKSPFEPEA